MNPFTCLQMLSTPPSPSWRRSLILLLKFLRFSFTFFLKDSTGVLVGGTEKKEFLEKNESCKATITSRKIQ